MPNHVTNDIIIVGTDKDIKAVREFMKGDYSDGEKNPFDFNQLVKMPPELLKGQGWYDWSINNWGTKWNSYSHYGFDDDLGEALGFQTAWSHPFPIVVALSNKFPRVQFNIRFADEDTGYNVGEYSILNGDVFNENFPEGGSDEAYELALDINGSEYELYDNFFDYDEEDFVGNTYMETCLRLAIKNRTLDEDIPTWVLHIALENCVEDEDFEYAEKLKGFISLAEAKEK
jgi:hypothetical protein